MHIFFSRQVFWQPFLSLVGHHDPSQLIKIHCLHCLRLFFSLGFLPVFGCNMPFLGLTELFSEKGIYKQECKNHYEKIVNGNTHSFLAFY